MQNTLKTLDVSDLPNIEILNKCRELLEKTETVSEARAVFNFFSESLNPEDLSLLFCSSKFAFDIFVPLISKNSDYLPFILSSIHEIHETPPDLRNLRRILFKYCHSRRECNNCFLIIQSVRAHQSSTYYV